MNFGANFPLSESWRFGLEFEFVGLPDVAIEQRGALDGTRMSGTLTGLAWDMSLALLRLRRFDLEGTVLMGVVSAGAGSHLVKVTAPSPELPTASYESGASVRLGARLKASYWLYGFESDTKPGALGLFGSLGVDAHDLWVGASQASAAGVIERLGPETAFYDELTLQLGVALAFEP